MDANKEYKRLFLRKYEGITWKRRQLVTAGNAEFKRVCDEVKKALRPKGSRKKLENIQLAKEVEDDILSRLRPIWVTPYDAIGKARNEAIERNKKRMDELADAVVVTPLEVFNRIRVAHTGTWSSQGYGAGKYAEGSLLPDFEAMKAAGLEPHISKVVTSRGEYADIYAHGMRRSYEVSQYELWVNCEPYVADAVTRRVTIAEACKVWKSHCINPLVYNPFLPHSIAGF